jgi:hypothetical protein
MSALLGATVLAPRDTMLNQEVRQKLLQRVGGELCGCEREISVVAQIFRLLILSQRILCLTLTRETCVVQQGRVGDS